MDSPLFNQMIKQAMEQDPRMSEAVLPPKQPERQTSPVPKPMSPHKALILGSLADSASTAMFLSKGRREANPALSVLNKDPWMIAPLAAGGALGYHLLHKLISKKSPKVADTLAGGLGSYHLAIAGNNMEPNTEEGHADRLRTVHEDMRLGKK